jgi:hypothetical protein
MFRIVNALSELFFCSLKHDWLLKVPRLIREHMGADITEYMRYYNLVRHYTAHGDLMQQSMSKTP